MPGQYAENTTVPVERSRAEIERVLRRYGAERFEYGWSQDKAIIRFLMRGRLIRYNLALPPREDRAFTHTPTGKKRTATMAEVEWEQACRQMWRALLLVIKAKLEAVASGITSFEDEFLAVTLLPSGETVGELIQPRITVAYETGEMPKLLMG